MEKQRMTRLEDTPPTYAVGSNRNYQPPRKRVSRAEYNLKLFAVFFGVMALFGLVAFVLHGGRF